MAKLTKAQAKQHAEACKILEQDVLSWDDRLFVLENWQESANHVNSTAGAFFTPSGLARDFAIDVGPGPVIDLCSGIGALAFAVYSSRAYGNRMDGKRDADSQRIVCVDSNPDYVKVGKKILPEAEWICASVFDLPKDIGKFSQALSNPPFGNIKHDGKAPRYTGKDFEYKVIDIASDIADYGCFILPQMSAPFRFSGVQCYEDSREGRYGRLPANNKYNRFHAATKIAMEPGCGVDTSYYKNDWRGVSPTCEIVLCDFVEARKAREIKPDLANSLPSPRTAYATQLAMFGWNISARMCIFIVDTMIV